MSDDKPVDLAMARRRMLLKQAGYEWGCPHWAVPHDEAVAELVAAADLADGDTGVSVLAPPQGLADGWILTPDQAETMGKQLIAKAAAVRAGERERRG